MSGPPADVAVVIGQEPNREGEFATVYSIGYGNPEITRIAYREDYYGDHSLAWFDAYAGDTVVGSLNARHTAEVIYAKGSKS